MAGLAPAPQPIGIFPQFLAAGPETLVLKEKVMSLTGDSFSIKLANGTPVLKVEGKVMSISGRKKMFDMNDNHLCSIVKEHFHLHSTYVVEGADGQKIMEVKSSFKQSLVMRGDFFDTQADIIDEAQNNLVVARIDRKLLSGKDIFFGQQTYGVQIAPGVDMALIAALCICLDEKNNEG
ncbi:duf567 domain-containing protein [Stemphylium lycopersici]|uniref:DUF567-domain-containing protein n=1 Tax=Stemphylium lycopersici TaxID=183478 RepID=A0A364NFV0_STELY|nr:duf567 domain-containing protein [Stemphylium lycopersici]RAR15991.1 DUF567-domain-containing protein [Stemphylium lycopersici]